MTPQSFAPGSEWYAVRHGWRYVVQRCAFADFLGSGYRFARYSTGRVARFWTRKTADAFAEKLNTSDAGIQRDRLR